jgi:trk system potassium uptake protein TrkA
LRAALVAVRRPAQSSDFLETPPFMQIVVIGAGEVGFDVARLLALEQHDVAVIDTDEEVLRDVEGRLDVLTIHGSGTSTAVLEEAGIRNADMLIAVTAIDEVNIIACMMADRLDVETTIARTRSSEIARSRSVLKAKDFGIDLVIHPEESAAAEVARLIRRSSATDVLTFADDRLQLIGVRLDGDAPVIGKTLREIVREHPEVQFRFKAILRGARTILPRGDETLREDDQVFVLTRPKYVTPVSRVMGKENIRMQRIMVLGGTRVGRGVVRQFEGEHKNTKLIEPDEETATEIAEAHGDVLVINADPTDIDVLTAEGLGEMDAVVAVTSDEESNLVTCLMAKHLGVNKTIGMLSKGAYIPISQAIGLDAAVSKKLAVSREIRRFLRGKHVLSVATVHGLDAEILEIEATPGAPAVCQALRDLDLPKSLLIGAVEHGDDIEIATGDTHIAPGDRAIVFVLPDTVEEAEDLFGKKA